MTSRYLFARRLFSGHLRPARVSVHACWTHSHPPILIHFFSHTYTHKRTLRHAHFAHTPMHAYTLADLFEGNSVSGFGKHMQSTGDTMMHLVLACSCPGHKPPLSTSLYDLRRCMHVFCCASSVLLLLRDAVQFLWRTAEPFSSSCVLSYSVLLSVLLAF